MCKVIYCGVYNTKLTSNNSPKTNLPRKIKGNPWCHMVQNPMKEPETMLGIIITNLRAWKGINPVMKL